MITFDLRVFTIETIVTKSLILEAVMVEGDDVYAEIALVSQDIAVLLQVAVIGFDIFCLEIVVSVMKLIIRTNLLCSV